MNGKRCNRLKKCSDIDNCAYKRTVRNNPTLSYWKTRNSSVQINSVLNPDFPEGELEKALSECSCDCLECNCTAEVTKTSGKIKWKPDIKKPPTKSKFHANCCIKKPEEPRFPKDPKIKRNQVVISTQCDKCCKKRKKSKFKNECYCNSKPDQPLIPIRPPVTQPNTKRTIISGLKSPEMESELNHDVETLKIAKNLLQDYAPESNFLRKLQKEARQHFDCQCCVCKVKEKCANLQFTKRRQMLENVYGDMENFPDRFDCKSPRTSQLSLTKNKYHSDISLSSAKCITDPSSSCGCSNIQTIRKIRDENYFDTHSTIINSINPCGPEQKCVHKFELDDRLLPTPLNADAFGVSRCIKCNKPMESIKNNRKPKLTPRKINIADNNEIVELKVPPILINNQKDYEFKYPLPHNTWALRHQRKVT